MHATHQARDIRTMSRVVITSHGYFQRGNNSRPSVSWITSSDSSKIDLERSPAVYRYTYGIYLGVVFHGMYFGREVGGWPPLPLNLLSPRRSPLRAALIFIVLALYIAGGRFYFRRRDGFIDKRTGAPPLRAQLPPAEIALEIVRGGYGRVTIVDTRGDTPAFAAN